ncbi:hypothetical protein QVD17_24085 [Tagetes erecta]|uniref:Uncharacterized protein n=1 Tax=Tagetes erecta TaxID=13708 RepID=A0AAD8KHR7_TARER|nr:hypothetical protein QVD17_24085 [Tagetes erecta]
MKQLAAYQLSFIPFPFAIFKYMFFLTMNFIKGNSNDLIIDILKESGQGTLYTCDHCDLSELMFSQIKQMSVVVSNVAVADSKNDLENGTQTKYVMFSSVGYETNALNAESE